MDLFTELKRRNVFRVGAAYAVVAWFIVQAADIMLANFGAPEWVFKTVAGLLTLGFPLALFLSWAYELTPDGMKKTADVATDESVAPKTGRRIDRLIVIALLGVIAILVVDRVWFAPSAPAPIDPVAVSTEASEYGSNDTAVKAESMAVLPFVNMSTDAANAYFADGISEEILNLLAGVEALSVASRTSAFSFKGKDTPVPEIARALGVRYVLEGSVRKAGNQVRVTAQLIDAETDRHLWSESFDRTLDDIFAIQDEIAGAIGQALQVELLGEAGQVVQTEAIDPAIYARFLEARHKLRQRTGEAMREANRMLIEIVEAEPAFARAHVVLGEAYMLNYLTPAGLPLVPDSVAVSQARLHAETARRLNPKLAGIDLILGAIAKNVDSDPVAALDHYTRAMELEPNEPRPYHWRGIMLCQIGFLVRGLPDLSQALRLDPENPNVHFATADCLLSGDKPEPVRRLARQSVELGNPGGMGLIAIAEYMLGNGSAAIAAIEGMIEAQVAPERSEFLRQVIRSLDPAAPAEADAGDPHPSRSPPEDWGLLLVVRRYDDYLEALEKRGSLPAETPGMWSNLHTAMRRDARFTSVMEKAGAFDLWRELGPPPDCRAGGDGFTCGHGHEPLEFRP